MSSFKLFDTADARALSLLNDSGETALQMHNILEKQKDNILSAADGFTAEDLR